MSNFRAIAKAGLASVLVIDLDILSQLAGLLNR